MIDFEIPEETRAIRNKVRQFVREECHPAEAICTDNFDSVLAELDRKHVVRDFGAPLFPKVRQHGTATASQCAGADGVRRIFPGRAVDEHARSR